MTRATVSADGETITVHIPLTFRKRGGRKLVVTPDGAEWAPRPRVDNAMVKALARAFRWRKMLDTGVYATLEDLARAKGVHATYVIPDSADQFASARFGHQWNLVLAAMTSRSCSRVRQRSASTASSASRVSK